MVINYVLGNVASYNSVFSSIAYRLAILGITYVSSYVLVIPSRLAVGSGPEMQSLETCKVWKIRGQWILDSLLKVWYLFKCLFSEYLHKVYLLL